MLSDCAPCCDRPLTTQVPGTPGGSAFTYTTATFSLPVVGNSVLVAVQDNTWTAPGQPIYISDGSATANFQILGYIGTTGLALKYLGYTNDSPAGTAILTGARVVPTGVQAPLAVTLPISLANGGFGVANASLGAARSTLFANAFNALTNLSDNTTGAASSSLAAGVGVYPLMVRFDLSNIAAANFVTFFPGHAFKIISTSSAVLFAATTAAKAATLTPSISGTPVTGGVQSLTSANMTPIGNVVAGTAVSGNNIGTSAQSITVAGSTITAFVEGTVIYSILIQNMDTANAFASIAAKINALQTGVGP